MSIAGRIKAVLNYKIEIDLDKKIARDKALFFLGVFLVLVAIAGYYIGDRWFWVPNKTYYENRIDNLKEVMKNYPGSNNVRAEMAMTDYLKGNTEKSIGSLKDIITQEPNNEVAAFYLGLIQCEQQEYRESIGLLTRYLRSHQGLETRLALLYLGRDYLAVGKYDLAVKNLVEAARRDPGNPVTYYYLGQTYEQLKNRKKAIESYEKALSISNNYVEADTALNALVKGISMAQQSPVTPKATARQGEAPWYYWLVVGILNIAFAAYFCYRTGTTGLTTKGLIYLAGYSMFIGMLTAKIPSVGNMLNIYMVIVISLLFVGIGTYYITLRKGAKEAAVTKETAYPGGQLPDTVTEPPGIVETGPEAAVVDTALIGDSAAAIVCPETWETLAAEEVTAAGEPVQEKEFDRYKEDLFNSYIVLAHDAIAKGNMGMAAKCFSSALSLNPPPQLETELAFDYRSLQKEAEQGHQSGHPPVAVIPLDVTPDSEIERLFTGWEPGVPDDSGERYGEDLLNSYIILGFDAKAQGKLFLAAKYFYAAICLDPPTDLETELVFDISSMYKGVGRYQEAKECLQEFEDRKSADLPASIIKEVKINIRYLEVLQEMLEESGTPRTPFSMVSDTVRTAVEDRIKEWQSGPRAMR